MEPELRPLATEVVRERGRCGAKTEAGQGRPKAARRGSLDGPDKLRRDT
jgi:hypothetical protein